MDDKNQSILIKDVYKINIRREIACQAAQLMRQVEYPVVFWMNAETETNDAAIHPKNRNQFWITIKPNTAQNEVERIVLANLYKQVQLRKRYMVAMPNKQYLESLIARKDDDALKRLRRLQIQINAFTSSLECEMYLAKHGIETDPEVRERGFVCEPPGEQ